MTKPTSDGRDLKHIAEDLETFCLESGDALTQLIHCLVEGKSTEALPIAIDLFQDNTKLLYIVTLIARKDFTAAELEAMKLVAERKAAS